MAALHDKLVKQIKQEEEAELAEEAERSRRSARRKAAAKPGAKGAGKTGAAVAPGTNGLMYGGRSSRIRKIKVNKVNNLNQSASGPIAAGSWNRPHPYPLPQERGCGARPMEATEADEGDQAGGYRSIKMIRSPPITSDHIRPNQTKSDQKNGPARIKARAIGSKPARTDLDLDRTRCIRGNAERMNGKTKGLSDRNTFLIYDTVERELGLEKNLHLSSLKFAYLRLMGEK